MSISYINSAAAAATSVAIPTHEIGDLIVVFAYRSGNNTPPTQPAAGGTVPTWNTIGSSGANTNSSIISYAFATATNTTTGTWTNATQIHVLIYRCVASIGASAGAGANNTTTVNYPALTLQNQNGTSWVIGAAGHRTASNVESAPAGTPAMTNRTSSGTGPESATHDTNGRVTAWNSTNVTVNASGAYRSWVVELKTQRSTIIT